ncbi:MAG: FAD-dependent oxidoreductase [Deltaproteobacteria bacterium]|nr:FAD-dependent oxidoreductase [Deltaproteobacteria bacterium]
MSLKNALAPFGIWARALARPYTIPVEDIMRAPADRYRGWHTNDAEACIGCGSCSDICQNAAIDMVVNRDATKGDTGLRPMVDYGRCCWCALCVDVCPSGSLGLSSEYTWVDKDPEVFRYVPGVDKKPWDDDTKGWHGGEWDLINHDRVPMSMLPGETRGQTWAEVVLGYSEEEAQREAARCLECGICTAACPAHMHIPEYIGAIRDGNYEQAVNLIYETNPMPEMCGKVCTRRCEDVCAHAKQGEPVAIRWLKRFATERFDDLREVIKADVAPIGVGKRVAVIGGGPSGITVAYYLAIRGFEVNLYEALPTLGGATFFGIPKYRFPMPSLEKQVDMLRGAGVKLHVNSPVDAALFEELRSTHDAVFIGAGLMRGKAMRVEGEDAPGVVNALTFLLEHHLRNNTDSDKVSKEPVVLPGMKVAVVGGGNTAIDAARVSLRLGASEVVISYRRRKEDMPADWEEIEDAEHENIQIDVQAIPLRIEQTPDGRLDLIWGPAEMVADKPGARPKPVLVEGVENHLVVDRIIGAIGQGPNLRWLSPEAQGTIADKWGWIKVNEDGMTGMPGVFAGGDLVNETADAISAIADGLRVVQGIPRWLGLQ